MSRLRRAFTLIELLVVIAIIAILAAILFPVFAQAKAAAKKTASLSQAKQLGTAQHIYLSDNDDMYPMAFGKYDGRWRYTWGAEVPADWRSNYGPQYVAFNNASWANSTQPYAKNLDLLEAPGVKTVNYFNENMSTAAVKKYARVGYTYNGLLSSYSASAVAASSQLPLLTQANGAQNMEAYAYANPFLVCDDKDQPCTYVPSTPDCDGDNGEFSQLFAADATMWVYGNGQNVIYADSSAKFRRYGANIGGRTDFRTDPFSAYDAKGIPAGQWQDKNWCHAVLFQPDFDFQDWGNPVEWK
jgi:prepilin-type N-terminal cleavage/methylation domain-containing protein